MYRIIALLAPIIMRAGAHRSTKTLGLLLTGGFLVILGIFLVTSAAFVWIAAKYSVDVAFLCTGILALLIGGAVFYYTRKTKTGTIAIPEGMKDDPLARYIPESVARDPIVKKILAQIEANPLEASAAAVALGTLISRELFDEE
ncbi:MAG: hypothetical protein HKO02_09875 [Hyphomonadaceae bacterium]|nr:hypothetical protein [Hyphomonadaceae bacterium]